MSSTNASALPEWLTESTTWADVEHKLTTANAELGGAQADYYKTLYGTAYKAISDLSDAIGQLTYGNHSTPESKEAIIRTARDILDGYPEDALDELMINILEVKARLRQLPALAGGYIPESPESA